MKIRLSLTLSLLLLLSSCAALALERNVIANEPEDITPLMNGQVIPEVAVWGLDGNSISLRKVVQKKPTVLIFYRGGWCPYCSAQLAGLKEMEDKFQQLGYQLLAISPDSPERLKKQRTEAKFVVQLMSDKKMDVIREFGLGFFLPDNIASRYRDKLGITFAQLDGTAKVALPVPAVYIVDQEGLILFNYVNPNFRVRVSPELVYEAAKLALKHSQT